MRKFNAVLGMSIFALFLIHIILGSMQLAGVMPGRNVIMIVGTILLLAAVGLHTLIGIKLTADTMKAIKKSGANYFKDNKLFWIRRISGFALMFFIAAHIIINNCITSHIYTHSCR